MKNRARRAVRFGILSLLLLLVAGIVAPFIRVDGYREQIRVGLQRALQRKVDIYGNTHLNLFRGPGFSVEKVVIHEHPSIGIEPMANVPELQTTVSLRSLWTGRLEFSTVRFVEPSLNLSKAEHGTWNVIPLVAGAATRTNFVFPEIQVSNGRLNFKLGDVKSSFYITETDLTISPGPNGIGISFSAAPARTDRSAHGYGLFTGQGRIEGGNIDLSIQIEKSPIEEFVTFARGQSLGLHGLVASRARMTGPVSNPQITGRFELEDVHRWDLIHARAGEWAMNYHGRFDAGSQLFELTAGPADNPDAPVSVRLLVSNMLTRPDWRAEVSIDRLPASALVEMAGHMGAPLPAGISIDGDLAGTIAYGSVPGMQGQIRIENATVKLAEGPQFEMPQASLLITGDTVRLLPADLSGRTNEARLEATYAPFRQRLDARLTAKRLRLADLQNGAGHLLNGISVPLVDRFRGGNWSGTLRYLSNGMNPGTWSAALRIEDTVTTVPGLAEPLSLASASVEIQGERISVRRMRASAGGIEILGDYRYIPRAETPHRFSIVIPVAELSEAERLLLPTLRRQSGFLARTLRWRSSVPEWLRTRDAEGSIQIGSLSAGDVEIRSLRSRVIWNGSIVRLEDVQARAGDAAVMGEVTADLTRSEPVFAARGEIRNLSWKGGHVNLQGSAVTSGTGLQAFTGLQAEGNFQARALVFVPEMSVRTASGDFSFTVARTGPQWRLTSLEAAFGGERFNGAGGTQPDGLLLIDLASTRRTARLSGPLASPTFEILSEQPPAAR